MTRLWKLTSTYWFFPTPKAGSVGQIRFSDLLFSQGDRVTFSWHHPAAAQRDLKQIWMLISGWNGKQMLLSEKYPPAKVLSKLFFFFLFFWYWNWLNNIDFTKESTLLKTCRKRLTFIKSDWNQSGSDTLARGWHIPGVDWSRWTSTSLRRYNLSTLQLQCL